MPKNNSSSFGSVVANPSGNAQKQHRFSEVPSVSIPRSTFDRSHGLKTTFNAMQIIPVLVDEALPGDTFHLSATFLARMATPIKPVMDNMRLHSHFFACPNRLVWAHWVNFCGEQENPTDSIAFTIPTVTAPAGGWVEGSLADYMGLPINVANLTVSALFFRAYNLMQHQWFRDENLMVSPYLTTGDGPDTYAGNYAVINRCKLHDYFTSCLPFAQKGIASTISLGGVIPVTGAGDLSGGAVVNSEPSVGGAGFAPFILDPLGVSANVIGTTNTGGGAVPGPTPMITEVAPLTGGVTPGSFQVDLSTATTVTINSLRLAIVIQQFLERDARGGTRYIEKVKAHFGVTSPDARLQRVEYLGGGVTRISVTPVSQTAPTSGGSTPQGNLAGYSATIAKGHSFSKSFTEHCIILGVVVIDADLTYQQGIERMWSRSTEYDFYWPLFANLGEQTVFNQEIYAQGSGADTAVFGYQERYAEYRYKPSKITGQFRSTYSTPLDFWHLADHYTSLPTLGSTWITTAPPMARIEAVTTGPDFIMDCHFSFMCTRPMPVYSIPGLSRL